MQHVWNSKKEGDNYKQVVSNFRIWIEGYIYIYIYIYIYMILF
ncbi:MAG: hypothetical protein N7Q72_01900 [Spiroplasma sp. Tabriz.8]|nr:hypothetical protein [Spiroplasma sp. Tabriz.8]